MATVTQPTIEELLKKIETFPFLETDGEPMDSPWHRDCMMLLIGSVLYWWRDREDFYVGGNMFIYFNEQQAMTRDYRGPDFFVVNGGVQLRPERPYWVVWRENGRYPDAVIELASPSTEREDRTTKFRIYERTFRTRNYFIYDPVAGRLDGWELDNTGHYRPLTPNERGWLWSVELGLWVGTWEGEYQRTRTTWLRFYDENGILVPTREEAEAARAADEKRRADEEQRRAEDERRRADAAETELERLRALLKQPEQGNGSSAPPA